MYLSENLYGVPPLELDDDDDDDDDDELYGSVAYGAVGGPSAPSWTDLPLPSLLGKDDESYTTSPKRSPRKTPVTSPSKSGMSSPAGSPSKVRNWKIIDEQ